MTHYVLLNAQFFDQSMKQIDIWTVDRSISVDWLECFTKLIAEEKLVGKLSIVNRRHSYKT